MRILKRLRAGFVYYKVYYSKLRILNELEGPHGGRAWFAGHERIVPTYKTIIAHWYSKSMIILSALFAEGYRSAFQNGTGNYERSEVSKPWCGESQGSRSTDGLELG